MKSQAIKIGIFALSLLFLKPLPVFSQLNNVVVAGGGITCPSGLPTNYCEVSSMALPLVRGGPAGNTMANGTPGGVPRQFDRWCVVNTSGSSIFVPTETWAEFDSFTRAATTPAWMVRWPGVLVGACCDPTVCVTHNGNCVNCINEGLGAACCDWACPGPNDVLTVPGGFNCCQDANAPQSPLVGGVCVDTCPDGGCQAWENINNCCEDCGSIGDGICCPADGENQFNECVVCPGGVCGDSYCCNASQVPPGPETLLNCADCAVCPDGVCSPGENSINCCQDCPGGFCGNGNCCAVNENQVNCCADCGCPGGTSCSSPPLPLACHDICDSLPYTHDAGVHQCTINAPSNHGTSPAGTCAVAGTCSGTCTDGNIVGWVNDCCTNWVPGACAGGGCPAYQRQYTRTCSAISSQPLTTCVSDVACCTGYSDMGCGGGSCAATDNRQQQRCGDSFPEICTPNAGCCTAWSNQGCDAGGCGCNRRQETRTCGVIGGQSQCVFDNGCCCGWSDTSCGVNNGCPDNEMERRRDCGGNWDYDCYQHGACCTGWTVIGCDTGCGDQERREDRWCGGSLSTNCILDGSCCTGWSNQGCGGGGCWQGEQRQERWCGGNPDTTCTSDGGCSWSGGSGSCYVGQHGQWANNNCGIGAPGGYQNYSVSQSTVGHRHGGSHFNCGGGVGCAGFGGSGDGGALGPEYGSGTNSPQSNFPCWGGGNTCGASAGAVGMTVQDAEAWFDSSMNAW